MGRRQQVAGAVRGLVQDHMAVIADIPDGLFVFPVVLEIVFTGKRRAWAWSGLVLAVGSAAILVAYLTGSLPV